MTALLACLVAVIAWLAAVAGLAVLAGRAIDRRDHPKPVIPAPRRELRPLPQPTSPGVSHDHRR